MPEPTARASPPPQPPPAPPGMALREVAFGYEPGQPVIRQVSAALRPARITAMIGPNAAGKSTLLRLMLGQLKPWSGQVLLAGEPVSALAAGQRAAWCSYVPQRTGAGFAFSVRQVVEMGRFVLTPDPAAVNRALALCRLEDVADRVYAHLSVGQQQRVLLARALAQSAGAGRVMLLDEPASAMDLWHTHHTMHLLQEAARTRGLAALVVVHDINLAARYADDVWLMQDGRLLAAGPWPEVLDAGRLGEVYGLDLRRVAAPDATRPLFDVAPSAKL